MSIIYIKILCIIEISSIFAFHHFKNNQALKKSNRLQDSDPLVNSVNFLFEDKKVSYIVQQGKKYLDKKNIYYETLATITDKDKLYEKLRENDFFNQKYKFLDISILNDKFTLIPKEYFDKETAEVFLNYNVPYLENMGLRFNLIPQFNLVQVFYYPELIDELFVESSDKIRITHTGFKFLSKIKNNNRRSGYFIQIYDNYFEVAVVENEKLILYNIYPYKIEADIEYFLHIIAKTIEKKLSVFTLYYYNLSGKETILQKCKKLFRDITPGVENDFERENYTILDV